MPIPPVENKTEDKNPQSNVLVITPTIASITASKKITWKSESSADINKWIEAYRNGDASGGEKLIVKFTPLMRKYKALLKGGNVSTGGDIGRFLSFFGKDKKKVADLLAKSLAVYNDSEIEALLNYCLLYTAIKYLKISAGFKFVLKGEVVKLTKDAATHRFARGGIRKTVSGRGTINAHGLFAPGAYRKSRCRHCTTRSDGVFPYRTTRFTARCIASRMGPSH